MSLVDYGVMISTLLLIVILGIIKTWRSKNVEGYFLGDNQLKWGTIGLSVMATQASAITFLSTPGQAYESGMGFVQNYLGLPLALIVVSAVFIPIYYKLKVFTAYEYLESRFDLKSRLLAASLFLIQRGLAAGITIYAPAIVLSAVLGWDLNVTILAVGIVVIVYTVSGGSKAVSFTQKWQMAVILVGITIAFGNVIYNLPVGIKAWDGLQLAGKLGKTEAIDFDFDIQKRYTFWSGIIGGFFLALSYFGTDQSQVQRYLGAISVKESRLGLMFNAILKIPMQFFILLIGVMVFVFYIFQDHRVLFDHNALSKIENSQSAEELNTIEANYTSNHQTKKVVAAELVEAIEQGNSGREEILTAEFQNLHKRELQFQDQARILIREVDESYGQKDSDYVFIRYVLDFLPVGLVGLLIAVIISAAMSSTSGELNALGSTTSIDFYKRLIKPGQSESHYVVASKWLTALWGLIALSFALFANLVENLIEAVNILGSIFYGTVLGIFLTAFFLKKVSGHAVFIAAIIGQSTVILCFLFLSDAFSYLYYNMIGCVVVMLTAALIQEFTLSEKKA